jgi:hypothetical protein
MAKIRAAHVTREPDSPAPRLVCPSCDHQLTFISTVVSGVQPIEYWDRLVCATWGGNFEYRRRTRKLRRTN